MLFIVASCFRPDKSEHFQYYSINNSIYLDALERFKKDHADFLEASSDINRNHAVKAVRIITRNHECVYFINNTKLIYERGILMYCYDFVTGNFKMSV